MDDPLVVRRGQRRGDLAAQPQQRRQRQARGGAAAQGRAVQVLHDDVGRAVGQAAEVRDADDAAVADDVDGAGLVEEARGQLRARAAVAAQHLDGDAARDLFVDRLVDRAGAALAQLADDAVRADSLQFHAPRAGSRPPETK
ncbi:MAG: hypothetical protein U1A78_38350 [Polyangia bacterium]